MEALISDILINLSQELGIEVISPDYLLLSAKIRNAVSEIRRERNYQPHHLEEFIQKDLKGHYSNIRELALYDFNQIGAEGQTSHSDNGISRIWKSRRECFNGIIAFCSSI